MKNGKQMKKIIYLTILLILTMKSYSLDKETFNEADVYAVMPFPSIILFSDIIKCSMPKPEEYYHNFGLPFDEKYTLKKDNVFTYLETLNNKFIFLKNEHWIYLISANRPILYGTRRFNDGGAGVELSLGKFDDITASSFLSEVINNKTIRYSSENLKNYDITLPWVDGRNGDGIGETIILRDKYTRSKGLVIFNGYISAINPNLYLNNNRVKEIIVTLDSGNDYKFKLSDSPELQRLEFPEFSSSFKIEIKSIYSGLKYNDTVISGIFQDLRFNMYKR